MQTGIPAEVVDPKEFDEEIDKLKKSGFLKLPVGDETNYHHIPITNGAFPEETEYKLNAYRKYVNDKDLNNDIKNLLLFACFCILEKISYTRKDGQYLRWDYRSKRTKAKLNKGKIYTFEEAIFDQLNRMSKDVREYNFLPFAKKIDIDTELITGSCLDLLPSIKSDSIDLVVTSPPYCNRYDYTRTYALELVFLGINKESIKTLRQSLLTCTVENKEKIDYLKDMYSKNKQNKLFDNAEDSFNNNKALKEVLSILQKYKEQKKLNNSGIYRMVKNYFYEHSFVIYELFRILKSGGRIYYVNDNVRYAGEAIPVDLILSEFAKNSGLKINMIYKLKKGKGNSSQQMSAHGKEELRKCVYYWEKI